MHAYRDSIRDGMNNPVIQYVAILYPGKTVNYTAGLTAVRAYPNEDEKLGMTKTFLGGLANGVFLKNMEFSRYKEFSIQG